LNNTRKHIAVALLNRNGKHWLEKFLPGVIDHSPEAQVYVIDNRSDDGSVEWIRKHFPEVKVIGLVKNYGFAGGYNRALKQIDEPFVILLNTDVEVTEHWIEPLINLLLSDDKVVAVQPKIKDYKNKAFFEYAGAAGGFIDNLGYPYCQGRIGRFTEKDEGQYDRIKEIHWASGACMAVKKDIFLKSGGFDEYFFAHQEEVDWAWRMRRIGYKLFFTPHATVYHVGGGSLSYGNAFKTYLNFRNNLIMLLKNLPSDKLFPVILLRLVLDGIAGLMYLLKLKPGHTRAIVKAHFSFYKMFKKYYKQRSDPFTGAYYKGKYVLLKAVLKRGL